MKPIQLKMTAFGPYKYTETINFADLRNHRLFVISGATGAGKTTIFDGISFALYGSGSGEDRKDTKMLRSDFALDDTHTSVELIFEIFNRKYRVLRQLPHVKKGNKSSTGEKYEFYEIKETGEEPVVERQIVSEINKKIEDIIGLTQDQFSQIVMLPQGEFRKLLTSSTENKEAILRKIFKTEPYRLINERLKEKKLVAEAELKKEENTRKSYSEQILASFPKRESILFELLEEGNYNIFQLKDALQAETNYYRDKIEKDKILCEEAYENQVAKQSAYYSAKNTNMELEELEVKENSLQHLLSQEATYKDEESRLEAAERAYTIVAIENYFKETVNEEILKESLLIKAKEDLSLTSNSLIHMEEVYHQEVSKKQEREQSVEAVIQLNALLPLMEDLEKGKQQLKELEVRQRDLKEQHELKIATYQQAKASHLLMKNEIEKLEEQVSPLDNKVQQYTQIKEHYQLMQTFIQQESRLEELKNIEEKEEKIYLKAQQTLQYEEGRWLNNQASILASRLVDGEACPVCGSTEHKPTSTYTHDDILTDDQVQSLKKDLTSKETSYLTVRAKREHALENIEKILEQLEELQLSILDIEQVKMDLTQLENEIEGLRSDKESLNSLKETYKTSVRQIEELEENKNIIEAAYIHAKSEYEQANAVLESKQSSIPSTISNLEELHEQINAATKQKLLLEEAWEQAQKKYKEAEELHTKAQMRLEHATQSAEEAIRKQEKAKQQFLQALVNAGFETKEEYERARMDEPARKALRERCEAYKQAVHTFTEQVKDGYKKLEGKSKVDLHNLEEELSQLKTAYETALNTLNSTKDLVKAGKEIQEKIALSSDRIAKLEQQVSHILDLYDLLRGQNPLKISFERYIQIEYLEQIIHAANERLKHLSNGQYQLMRSDRQETHGKQSGLGLDVYDAYTGQIRDVKTLSGGEKFNASLCLALGMADVIQGYRGSVRIDTMFIDEGFGSLDEESLNKAIDTLVDLQKSGRMVGVISHVSELKSAIPAILEVEKLKEGYSRTKFVIK